MGSETISVEPDNAPETSVDHVVGGFTVISEKAKPTISQVIEIYPYWIQHGYTFSANLDEVEQVDDADILDPSIRQCLRDMGIATLFPVQCTVVPYILNCYRTSILRPLGRPRDICICAPTGSGKTLAYAIPIVQLLHNRSHVFVRCLIVLPVRDLAVQVYNVIKQLVQQGNIKVALLAGLKCFTKEQADLVETVDGCIRSKVDIVVTTPGRLVDHLYNTHGFSMHRLRFLVIDEADRVITEEKQDWYHALEESLYHRTMFGSYDKASCKRRRPISTIEHQYDTSHDITLQKILVSATLTHDPGPLKQFNLYFPCLFTSSVPKESEHPKPSKHSTTPTDEIEQSNNIEQANSNPASEDPVKEDVQTDTTTGVGTFTTPSGLQEFSVSIHHAQRPLYLVHLVRDRNIKRILCFTNSCQTATRLHMLLKNFANIRVSCLFAKLPAKKRQRIINSFGRGDSQILVCTDAMARGIDIPNVECVVSYEMPPSVKIYVHRVGRTARAGKSGLAYTLLGDNQFRPFINNLREVGKARIRQVPFHARHIKALQTEYRDALAKLEASLKLSKRVNSQASNKDKKSAADSTNSSNPRKRKLDESDSNLFETTPQTKKKHRKTEPN